MDRPESTPRKAALFDVCHTLVDVTTITDFTEHFLLSSARNPAFSPVRSVYHFAYKLLRALKICNDRSYRLHFFKLLRGYSEEELTDICSTYAAHLQTRIKTEALQRLEVLRRSGCLVYLVSAGLDVYLRPFAKSLGVGLICTVAECGPNGRYTGAIEGIDCVGKGKVEKVRREIPEFSDISWENSESFGDSGSDIPVLEMVGNPCAVDPDVFLEQFARTRGWVILRTHSLN